MNAARRFRPLARLLAAWLALWFAVMAAAPWVAAQEAAQACADMAAAMPAGHEGHAGHEHHACGDDEDAGGAHAGHQSHCPLCLHAAAPPPPVSGERAGIAAGAARPAAPSQGEAPVRTDVPPPARGPPRVS